MKLCILGATSKTGHFLVPMALERGYEVTIVKRTSSQFTLKHERLKVVEDDNILSVDFLANVFKDSDVIMSCLGSRTLRNASNIYSESIKVIIEAMRKASIVRLVTITAWCTIDDPNDRGPLIMEWFLKRTFLRNISADMTRMETFMRESCSDINYTIVRPPELVNRPSPGKEIKIQADRHYVPGCSTKFTREDLSKFMLNCLETKDYDSKMVSVGI